VSILLQFALFMANAEFPFLRPPKAPSTHQWGFGLGGTNEFLALSFAAPPVMRLEGWALESGASSSTSWRAKMLHLWPFADIC
jgi:hypothetical protein